MTAIDDGLPAATQRVMDVLGCAKGLTHLRTGLPTCGVHRAVMEGAVCKFAEAVARAAREGVAETVREARASELEALAADMESGAIGHKDDWGVEVIYTVNLTTRVATIRAGDQ